MVPVVFATVIYAVMTLQGEPHLNSLIVAIAIFTIISIGQVENRLHTMQAEIERLKGESARPGMIVGET